ncbi:MAG TPA: hypothetical protein VL284_18660 [Thermoanaerobaculia bacterium]|nr:hypothetical protein [Thermoanaerobaculia bacterium]
MSRASRVLAAASIAALAFAACHKEQSNAPAPQPEAFSFVVYPGAQYLQELTDLDKKADKLMHPNGPIPPLAIYDTDAPLDTVADYYVKQYGYDKIAPDVTNNLSAAKPAAYYRTGDLHTDTVAIQSLLQQLNVKSDMSKAQGSYRAVEIESKTNRPRVTIQRPYFDVLKSQVIDRTMILMAP